MNVKTWIATPLLASFAFFAVAGSAYAELKKYTPKPAPARPAPVRPGPAPRPPGPPANVPRPGPGPQVNFPRPGPGPAPGPHMSNLPPRMGPTQPGIRPGPGFHPATPPPPVIHANVTPREELQRKMSMQATRQENLSAIRRFNDQRSMFRPMPGPIHFSPAYRPLFTKVRIVPATYHYRREVFYAHYNYMPPPYVYRMYPVYGVWDSTFLSFMLDHINEQQYALMYYNHQNEDAMQQWRAELDQMAVDNEDLKAQLAAMDTKMASLQGTPIDPSYVPEDAQDIALAPEVIDQAIGQQTQS